MILDNGRWERGEGLWARGAASTNGAPGQWYVKSDSGNGRYLAATPWAACEMRCDCPDHTQRGAICKHIIAASLAQAQKQVAAYLAKGGDLQALKAQGIMAGLTGPETPKQAVVWRAAYQIICMIEDGELEVGA